MINPNNNNGFHYEMVDLRTCKRDPLPNKQQADPNWQIAVQNQDAPIWNLFTPNRIKFGLASASMQGAIRQGRIFEAIQWIREMIRTDAPLDRSRVGKGENNLWHRLFVICFEDIGLANPACVIAAAQIINYRQRFGSFVEAELYAINFGVYLCRAVKSRALDWACICRFDVPEQFEIGLYCNRLSQCLINKDVNNALGYAEGIISASLQDKKNKVKDPLPKKWFDAMNSGLKHFKNKRQALWAVLIITARTVKLPNVGAIVQACYDVAHADEFRWTKTARLFGRMAIMTLCYRDQMEIKGLNYVAAEKAEPVPDEKLLLNIVNSSPLDTFWYGVSDICKDKHTSEGASLGRGIQHFVEIKSFLRHEDPALMILNDYYLDLCFSTRYHRDAVTNGYFDNSQMTVEEYRKWLPNLRLLHNQLNLLTDESIKPVESKVIEQPSK